MGIGLSRICWNDLCGTTSKCFTRFFARFSGKVDEYLYIALDSIDCVDFINDLGMDSIMFITLVVEIETRFDITIPDHLLSMEHFNTIDAAVDIVSKLSLNN